MAFSDMEKGLLLRLFNREGYVLDFSTNDFDNFTMSSVGVSLCEHYGLSKGRSLTSYVNEADGQKQVKLLCDLFEYYETMPAFDKEREGTSTALGAGEYRSLYLKCKSVVDRERSGGVALMAQRADLESHFNSEYMKRQIDTLYKSREVNPTEAIGKAKELIESCCKTILEESGVPVDEGWSISQLVKNTMKTLGVAADDINDGLPAGDTVKRILSSLGNIASGVAELRNPYGTGHGKSDSYRGLSVRHAKLAVGSSATLVEYLWDAHLWRRAEKRG